MNSQKYYKLFHAYNKQNSKIIYFNYTCEPD